MNLSRGNSVTRYLGVEQQQSDTTFRFAPDYSYIEVQLGSSSKDGTLLPGDFVVLKPSIEVDPKKCKIQVVPNAVLSAFGSVSCQSILEPGDGNLLAITLKVEREVTLEKLPWLCRLYGIYG
jgi:hypothetical protein